MPASRVRVIASMTAVIAMVGAASAASAETVRASDSLPQAGAVKRVELRAGPHKGHFSRQEEAAGPSTEAIVVGGLAVAAVVGGVVAVTQGKSP